MTRPFDFSQAAVTGISILPNLPPLPNAGDILSVANTNGGRVQLTYTPISTGGTGPFLPLAGGTMLGPLNYIATGSTTARSIQDRAAVAANVLDFGADPTGVADSTAAFLAAIATGRNVYAPKGVYIIRNTLTTTATGQEFSGDGVGMTELLIDQTFSASATCVISLVGREHLSPTVSNLTIKFRQPSDQANRANFKTLAAGGTSGTGGTGVMYPPAIGLTDTNRFRIHDVKITLAWTGIANLGANLIGGFVIRDVQMSALNVGLDIYNVFDFAHIVGFHMWCFDMSTALKEGVWWDGNTFAAKFGVTGDYGVCNCTDFNVYDSRVQIGGANSAMVFHGLHMDGNNSTLEISNGNQIQISNCYFSGVSTGANPSTAQLNITGGNVMMVNTYFQTSSGKQSIFMSGGKFWLVGGEVLHSTTNTTLMVQTGGRSYISGVSFAQVAGAWTVPVISVAAPGVISFHGNSFVNTTVSDVGGLVITGDSALHSIGSNFWNKWTFTPPGPLADCGYNTPQAAWGKQLIMGTTGQGGRIDFRRGADGLAVGWIGMGAATSNNHIDITNIAGTSNIRLNATAANVFQIAGVEVSRIDVMGHTIARQSGNTAVGAGFARLAFVNGTTAGTAKLVAYAGTSTTAVTIMDNIGTGF